LSSRGAIAYAAVMANQTARRLRRSSEEIRTRLIEAARELFLERGYDATTTREICDRADVAETQLFSNFGSKDGIFDAAFVEPFAELVNRYVASWAETASEAGVEERVSMFVNGLFDLASDNRTILLAAVGRRASHGGSGPSDMLDHLAQTFTQIDTIHLPGVDTPAATAAAAGMVFGVVLLDDMLFAGERLRRDRDRLTTQMTKMIVHGVLHAPAE
jgi:AcrR family transcriptional regulator